jgi:microcompartment protein CcmL/EutN
MGTNIQAVGMIEFNSIAAGMEAADRMVKAASVELLLLKTICPGKFLVGVHAGVAAVQASVAAGLALAGETTVDHFIIPNIHPDVITAMSCAIEEIMGDALGVIETFSAASSIVAADLAIKAANVSLIEVRIAMGLGGKAFCTFSGDVASVDSAVKAGSAAVAENGLLVRKAVISNIDPQVLRHIM